jgi:diguanylate cyclase (GGDEF)-like protein
MKLINGQIRLIEKFDTENRDRAYVCQQLENPGVDCFVKILDRNKQGSLIENYIDRIEFYKSIDHRGILSTIDFGPVRTVDLKEASSGMYYILSEFTPWETLDVAMDSLDTYARGILLLKLIEALEYIHFRGISYDVLSPDKIFVNPEGDMKLLNITSVVHRKLQADKLRKVRDNLTPKDWESKDGNDAKTDCWSLGVIVEMLFSQSGSALPEEKQIFINALIEDLMTKNPTSSRKTLSDHFEDIRNEFGIDYARDLGAEREKLQLGVLPGRTQKDYKHYLSRKSFDKIYDKGYMGLMVDGHGGVGKKKYIREIFRRRGLEGDRTYIIEAGEGDYPNIDYFKTFLVKFCEVLELDYVVDSESNDIKIGFDESLETFRLDQLDSKLRLFNCITEELVKISRRETVYFGLMNIHNADLETLNLIDFIVTKARGRRIFFVFSIQKNKLSDDRRIILINQWQKNGLFEELQLENLSKFEAEEYIHDILGNNMVPKELSNALYNETLGNPRYTRVLIKHFVDNGIIHIDGSGFWNTTTDDYRSFYDSATLKKTITRQIRSLSEKEVKVLSLLSCFNHPPDLTIFLEALGMEELESGELIQELANRGIARIDLQAERTISFVEGDFKRQIYSNLQEDERVDLHRRISDVLLSRRDENHVVNFDSLVHHLSESRQLDRMVKIVFRRLDKEKNRYNENSVNILNACYGNLRGKDHPSKLMVLEYLTEALLAQRRYTEGMDFANTYVEEAQRVKSDEHKIKADLIRLEFMIRAGDYNEALQAISEYEPRVSQPGYEGHMINLYKLKSIIYQVLDRVEESQATLERALQLSEEHDIHQHDGDLYNLQGIGNYLVGDHEKVLNSYHKSIDTYVLSDRDFDRIKPLNNIGNLYNEIIGDPQKALDYYFQCLRVSDENGLSSFQTITLTNICDVYLTLGYYAEARTYIDKTIELSHLNGDRINEFHGNVYRGVLELSLQNMEAATDIFLRVREFNKEEPIVEKEVIVHYLDFLGRFYMELGDYELGKMFSRNTMDKSKDFNLKLYFRSKARIIIIDSIINMKIDKREIQALLEELGENTNDYEKASFLIEIMHICLHIPDRPGYEFLRELYLRIGTEEALDLYGNDFEIMNVLVARSSKYVEEAIDLLGKGSQNFSQSICRYYAYLGELLYEEGDYRRAARYLIGSMDLVQAKINQIGIDGYRGKILANYNIPRIKSILDEIFRKEFNISPEKSGLNGIQTNLVGGYLSMLNYEQYNQVFQKEEDINLPDTVEGILSSLTGDYRFNLELILNYLHRETGAKDSLVNIFKLDDTENDSNLIRIGQGEFELSMFVDNALRTGETVIFNRDLEILPMDISRDYFDKRLSGFIGTPIMEPISDDIEVDRRSSSRKSKVLGYVYLQTDSAINRFDEERLQLSISMAKLMYLNLENRKLQRRANYDRLTNILSRETIENEIEEIIEVYNGTDNEFSILMMDIDKFKDINDSYGHQKGDQILGTIGKILNENTRTSDHIGRYGGEEFLVLLENISIEDTRSVAEAIRRAIQEDRRFAIDRKVTISIGVSHYPDHGTSKEDLVYKADQALYFAKEILGRNNVSLWDENMEGIENISSKGHKLTLEAFGKSQNGIVSLLDIAVLSKSQEALDKKLFRFLGAINESIDAELCSVLIMGDGEITGQYTREGVGSGWSDNKEIADDLIGKILETRQSVLTVNWDGAVYNMGTVDISSLKSIMVTPVIVGEVIKAVVYCESSLRRKDFTTADLMALEVLSGVFSVNLV